MSEHVIVRLLQAKDHFHYGAHFLKHQGVQRKGRSAL